MDVRCKGWIETTRGRRGGEVPEDTGRGGEGSDTEAATVATAIATAGAEEESVKFGECYFNDGVEMAVGADASLAIKRLPHHELSVLASAAKLLFAQSETDRL